MRQLSACVRGVNDFPKRVYYTCNPGGPGHGYIKRLFIDRRYEPGEDGEDYAFIPARVTDNRALLESQPEYVRQLEALPPKLRAAWLASRLARRSINVSQLEDILSARQTRQASRQRGSWVMVSGHMWVWMICAPCC